MLNKNNRLTFYIFIAVVAGIVLGYFLNVNTIAPYNDAIETANAKIQTLSGQVERITNADSPEATQLKAQLDDARKVSSENSQLREKKLQLFTVFSDVFLRLIKMIVGPLIISTLIVGIAKLGDISAVGRIGGKTLLWFFCASLLSLLLGMVLVNIFRPGDAMNLPIPDQHIETGIQKTAMSFHSFITHMFPRSIAEALATNEILQIVVFSIFFGVAAAAVGEQAKIVVQFFDAVAHIILKVTGYVMNFAPLAVFGSMTAVVAKQGPGILSTYAIFIIEFYGAMILLWIVLTLITSGFIGKKAFQLVGRLKDPMILAFSTSTSEAAFPKTLEVLERFGCKNKIASFVMPLGYSFNLDGSMIYMTFASLFIAQSYGIQLSWEQQITMLLMLMLTSKGIAGVPRASLVVIAGTIATFNIPEAGIALLLGVDPLLDMGRSATNVLGNGLATAVVSKWEGELGEPIDDSIDMATLREESNS